jgi:hypothetical protein
LKRNALVGFETGGEKRGACRQSSDGGGRRRPKVVAIAYLGDQLGGDCSGQHNPGVEVRCRKNRVGHVRQ